MNKILFYYTKKILYKKNYYSNIKFYLFFLCCKPLCWTIFTLDKFAPLQRWESKEKERNPTFIRTISHEIFIKDKENFLLGFCRNNNLARGSVGLSLFRPRIISAWSSSLEQEATLFLPCSAKIKARWRKKKERKLVVKKKE